MKEDVRHYASCRRFGMQRRAVALCPDAFLFYDCKERLNDQ